MKLEIKMVIIQRVDTYSTPSIHCIYRTCNSQNFLSGMLFCNMYSNALTFLTQMPHILNYLD